MKKLLIPAILLLFVGCEGPEGPVGPEGLERIYVIGGVETPVLWDPTGDASVMVFNIPAIPSVEINGIRIPFHLHEGWFGYKHWDFPISAGDSANLLVTYTKLDGNPGTARANIMVPDQFEITSHDTLVTIPVGDSLTIAWAPSNGADAYSIGFWFGYDYIDTLGGWGTFRLSLDTLLTSTYITFPSSKLFPDVGEIDTIIESRGHFHVSAIAGPWQEGDVGNVTGDGMGFFYGWTFGGYLDIEVSGSKYLAREEREPRNRLQEFLKERAEKMNLY